MTSRWIGLGLLLLSPVTGWGQVHNSRQPSASQVRAEYMEEAAKGVQETVTRWREAVAGDQLQRAISLFAEGAHYSRSDGASHYGTEAIEAALTGWLPGAGAVSLTRVDFSASGSLAYQFGRYFYGPGPTGEGAESGTYVLVLQQSGRDWKIRSYVERRSGG